MSRRFWVVLGVLLLAGLLARLGYLAAQPSTDPTFARPMMDGAVYVAWAKRLATAGTDVEGAYYLGPLYPLLLAGWMRILGGSFTLLYLVQHVASLATAGLLGVVARRAAGDGAGWACAALALAYHPMLFFSSRPLSEPVSLLFLALALALACARSPGWGSPIASGVAAGIAALGRPNLLLVPLAWALSSRGRRAVLVLASAFLVLVPVAWRNHRASGHWVPISANGGITLYHGNGPGARGVYTPPVGLSGDPLRQREEATALARARSGRPLDPVEADRWWRDAAVRARIAAPLDTLALLGRRLVLLVDTHEHGLDDAPSLDQNPWRWAAPVPFALLLGLAAAGVALRGLAGTGGWPVWGATLAAAVTPLVFYVSSRYRLPFAVLLTVPAGIGAAALLRERVPSLRALGIGAAAVLASVAVPSGRLVRAETAVGLGNRAIVRLESGDAAGAERDARRALEIDPSCAPAAYNLAVVLEGQGKAAEAEATYRRVLGSDPGHAEAAGNLARILILRGAPQEAIPILRRALATRPFDAVCWTNLVLAAYTSGDVPGARQAAQEAAARGVSLDDALLATIQGTPEAR